LCAGNLAHNPIDGKQTEEEGPLGLMTDLTTGYRGYFGSNGKISGTWAAEIQFSG
jgi:hypothetical protein